MKIEIIKKDKNSLGIDIYCVKYGNEDEKIIEKINKYAEMSAGKVYKRSGMDDFNHKMNIVTGKKAEEAFYFLIKKLKPETKITKTNYEDGVDKYDFYIHDKFSLDVKSSSLLTRTKKYSLLDAYHNLNFMVLNDQSRKDIIVQVFYEDRLNTSNFYFLTWVFVEEVIKKNDKKYIKMNGNSGDYFLLKIKYGNPILSI